MIDLTGTTNFNYFYKFIIKSSGITGIKINENPNRLIDPNAVFLNGLSISPIFSEWK